MTEKRMKAIADLLKPPDVKPLHSYSEIKEKLIWKEVIGAITALIQHGDTLTIDRDPLTKVSWMLTKIEDGKFVFIIVIDFLDSEKKSNRIGIFYDDQTHIHFHLFTDVKEPDHDVPQYLEDAQHPELCLLKMHMMYQDTDPYKDAESVGCHMMDTLASTAEESPSLKPGIEVLWRVYRRIFEGAQMEVELFRMYPHADLVIKALLSSSPESVIEPETKPESE